jgi:hypothetical protein
MGQIVRKVKRAANQDGYAFEDVTEHKGEGLQIEVHRRIDFNPMVRIEWRRLKGYGGITLKLFRNTTGFCPTDRPEDLTRHGQMILESVKNGEIEQHLAEGTYFYTFQFYQSVLFGLSEKLSRPIRFTVEVPSLDTALKRVGDWHKLEEMQHEQEVREVTRVTEQSQAILSLGDVMNKLLAAYAEKGDINIQKRINEQVQRIKEKLDFEIGLNDGKKRLIDDLQANEAFKSMPKTKQKRFVKMVGDEFDGDEQAFQA